MGFSPMDTTGRGLPLPSGPKPREARPAAAISGFEALRRHDLYPALVSFENLYQAFPGHALARRAVAVCQVLNPPPILKFPTANET